MKVLRDLTADPAKNIMLVLAIAVGVFGVGAILGAYSVLTRTMAENYLGTVPASATIRVDERERIEKPLVDEIAAMPGIASAERRATIAARMRVGDRWMPLLLFVIDDFGDMRLNKMTPVAGGWPPPTGTILVERTALEVMQASAGDSLVVRAPHGPAQSVRISGVVHDPGLAPAWQEKEGYAYLTPATLAALGETEGLDELRILVDDPHASAAAIEARAQTVAVRLASHGYTIHEIDVPKPRFHPHQGQMNAVLSLFIAFSFLTSVLGAILVASAIATLMTRQIREIGVMKAIGASSRQIAALYLGVVGALALVALAVGVPLGRLAAGGLVGTIAQLLNLSVRDGVIPAWVMVVQIAAGLLVPLAAASVPIWRGSRITVRQALDNHGVADGFGQGRIDRALARLRLFGETFTLALRNTFRRRARLVMTLGLLAVGGATFLGALNLSYMWKVRLRAVLAYRRDDVELRLAEPLRHPEPMLRRIDGIPGVTTVEAWNTAATALVHPGEYAVVHTYPDRGHASFTMVAVPASTMLLRPYPIVHGRWLGHGANPDNEVVLNQFAHAQAPQVQVGDTVHLAIEGKATDWHVVGFAQDIGTPGAAAYVSEGAFARVAGTGGAASSVRVAYVDRGADTSATLTPKVEATLESGDVRLASTMPVLQLRSAIADHMRVLVTALLALAILMALVGALGLASTMSVNVLERTRELGVMRAIGATPATIARLVMIEGLVTGGLSLIFAFALSLPLSSALGAFVGRMAFKTPLALSISLPGLALWSGLIVVGSIAATWVPARRASTGTTREALAYQ